MEETSNKRLKIQSLPSEESSSGILTKSSYHLFDLPNEILVIILRNLSREELSISVRRVSKRILSLVRDIVGGDFMRIGDKLKKELNYCRTLLLDTVRTVQLAAIDNRSIWFPNRHEESTNQSGPVFDGLIRGYHLTTVVYYEYKLTLATIWRYVYWKRTMSMFAGSLVDSFEAFLSIPIKEREKPLTDKIRKQCEMYQDHVENTIEKGNNKTPLISGAKLIDLLDSLIVTEDDEISSPSAESSESILAGGDGVGIPNNVIERSIYSNAERIVISEIIDGKGKSGNYRLECEYRIPYAWYTCLYNSMDGNGVSPRRSKRLRQGRQRGASGSLRYNQRFRNLAHCLRRMINRYNYSLAREEALALTEYINDNLFDSTDVRSWFRAIHHDTYTFYGVMNRLFYRHGIGRSNHQTPNLEEIGTGSAQYLPLSIKVSLECSPELAPKSAIIKYSVVPHRPTIVESTVTHNTVSESSVLEINAESESLNLSLSESSICDDTSSESSEKELPVCMSAEPTMQSYAFQSSRSQSSESIFFHDNSPIESSEDIRCCLDSAQSAGVSDDNEPSSLNETLPHEQVAFETPGKNILPDCHIHLNIDIFSHLSQVSRLPHNFHWTSATP